MEQTIRAAAANRKFSQLLRAVREGHSYVVTSHGRAVAKIVPVGKDEKVATSARGALLARLQSQPFIDIGHWSRDELYEDER